MDSSQFSGSQSRFEAVEQIDTRGATCDTFRVKLYGKLHFLKRLKPEYAGDIRYQEALRKEFETGYRLEHPNLVRYLSLDGDSILMEYVDGEPLSQRIADNPYFFRNRKQTGKLIRQILTVIQYLHSSQVQHLDLKPDNILLTRINDDVKLIDLGCCRTDVFVDTQGYTSDFAAPEQLSGGAVDVRTDIYAFGKILECLPDHRDYEKVIARCTASEPADRYQSVEEILSAINCSHRYSRYVAAIVALVAILSACIALFTNRENAAPSILVTPKDSVAQMHRDSIVQESYGEENHRSQDNLSDRSIDSVPQNHGSVLQVITVPQKKDVQALMLRDLDKMIDKAYRSTIATFCDSVFPSLTVGRQWEKKSSEFHALSLQAAADLSAKYPDVSESFVIQQVESRFQNLAAYVFGKMRENGQRQITDVEN